MLIDSIQDGIANTILRQMGATKIKTMPAHINIVTFVIDEENDVEVQYVYEMKENETIYLERTTPFPHFIGEPTDIDDLIDMISQDYQLHKEAYECANYGLYMEIGETAYKIRNAMDRMLLNKKIADPHDLVRIYRELQLVLSWFDEAEENMEEESESLMDRVKDQVGRIGGQVGQQVRGFVKQKSNIDD